MAKFYPEVFAMVMSQMEQIRENCVLMSDSMGRGEAAQDTLTKK